MIDAQYVIAGEQLVLLPERALYWPRTGTLFIADTHWGKPAVFRRFRHAPLHGGNGDDMPRLDQALKRTGAQRLVVLGDLVHD